MGLSTSTVCIPMEPCSGTCNERGTEPQALAAHGNSFPTKHDQDICSREAFRPTRCQRQVSKRHFETRLFRNALVNLLSDVTLCSVHGALAFASGLCCPVNRTKLAIG